MDPDWQDFGYDDLFIAVNLSCRSLPVARADPVRVRYPWREPTRCGFGTRGAS